MSCDMVQSAGAKQRKQARKRALQVQTIQAVRRLKEKPCADCCVQYPYYVMEFDHRPGVSKIGKINTLMKERGGAAGKRVFKEIAKCDVVCANCHRERTQFRIIRNQVLG